MKMQQLACFCEIAHTRSFSSAAKNLFMSQPSVSYNIRELEKELNVSLFSRGFNSSKVELSPHGEILLDYAREILQLVDECKITFNTLDKIYKKQLTCATSDRQAYDLMPKLVNYAMTQMPNNEQVLLNVNVCYSIEDAEQEILNGNIDFAIYPDSPSDSVESEVIWHDELIAFIPSNHPAARKDRIKLKELGDMPMAYPAESSVQLNKLINKIFEDEGFYAPVSSHSYELAQSRMIGVKLGQCYTISVDFPFEMENITKVHIDTPYNIRDIYAMWPKGAESNENLQLILDYCRKNYPSNPYK